MLWTSPRGDMQGVCSGGNLGGRVRGELLTNPGCAYQRSCFGRPRTGNTEVNPGIVLVVSDLGICVDAVINQDGAGA